MRLAREKLGKTQTECAREYAILQGKDPSKASQSTWWRMEMDEDLGERSYLTIWMISHVLECEPEDLVKEVHRQAIIVRKNKKKGKKR